MDIIADIELFCEKNRFEFSINLSSPFLPRKGEYFSVTVMDGGYRFYVCDVEHVFGPDPFVRLKRAPSSAPRNMR